MSSLCLETLIDCFCLVLFFNIVNSHSGSRSSRSNLLYSELWNESMIESKKCSGNADRHARDTRQRRCLNPFQSYTAENETTIQEQTLFTCWGVSGGVSRPEERSCSAVRGFGGG